jgi:REP element-mobilizing transposase RayT
MSHSLTKIWIHAIWVTKYRMPLIDPSSEKLIYEYIKAQFIEMDCSVSIINEMPDHIHCLYLLNPRKSLADVMKQTKGSTSHHINTNNLVSEKFMWQTGYAAFGVSHSILERTYKYIAYQKQHHSQKMFDKEYKDFLRYIKI